jgi:hypothetical protein
VGGGEIKENGGGVRFNYDICIIVRTLINVTIYPKYNNNKKIKN